MSLTGDPFTDALVPAATALVWACRERDGAEVERLLAEIRDDTGRAGVDGLIVVLAAMVPDDLAPSDLLAWMANPAEYLRLRTAGVDSYAAARLCRDQPVEGAA